MRLLRQEPRVWMDAGPFFRFCDAGKLTQLARYLGANGHWVVDVANEIELRASSPKPRLRTHPGLQNLTRLAFPADPATELDKSQQIEVEDIRRDLATDAEHPKKHRGEIATVIVARDLGGELALIDDGDGLKLARAHGVPTLSTTNLAVEMMLDGKLTRDEALAIYLSVQRRRPLTEASFERAVQRY